MEDNKILKLVYTFFLGLLLAIFVGVGINTFYPPPEVPDYPSELEVYREEPNENQREQEKQYQQSYDAYEENTKPYNRNVSIITLVAAVILIAVSIIYDKKLQALADGIMLGGLFTLLYSIGRGFASESSEFVFLTITIGLAVVLYLGYHRFVQQDKSKKSKK